jgi:hypothetical protein
LLRRLGDTAIDFKPFGGCKSFLNEQDRFTYANCLSEPFINDLLRPLLKGMFLQNKLTVLVLQGTKRI